MSYLHFRINLRPPIYRWPPTTDVAQQILEWWQECADRGQAAVLFCYALGKAQRILAELGSLSEKTVHLHGALVEISRLYQASGISMIPFQPVSSRPKGASFAGDLILAPPSARTSPWMRRFGSYRSGFASGWMRVRGTRRRRAVDRGFVISDHADWPGLLRTVEDCGAAQVLTTHGYSDVFARFLREEKGLQAQPIETAFEGELED